MGRLNKLSLTIAHLYPNSMSTYGDRGNILVLQKRAMWRGINTRIVYSDIGDKFPKADLYFWGGGQDTQQVAVSKDVKGVNSKIIKRLVQNYVPFLLICGGYQLMGDYYQVGDKKISGVGALDVYTKAGSKRMIGNTVIKTKLFSTQDKNQIIIGFENHSGKTYLSNNLQPLGKVIKGYGNNGEDKTEGVLYKNTIGCYQHGPLLPKNPFIADWLLSKALEVKYNKKIPLTELEVDKEITSKARSVLI